MEPVMDGMKKKGSDCRAAESAMPDFLFDPGAVPPAAQAHFAACRDCRAELHSLQGTMQLLNGWHAPEPSPFWEARMGARLREEQARPARGWAGFVEGLRTRLWISNRTLKPAAGIAALGLVLAAGGGTWLELAQPAPAVVPAQASNTVRDLQSLNENAEMFQQLSTLDAPDSGSTDSE